MGRLNGRVVFVTGAARGQGRLTGVWPTRPNVRVPSPTLVQAQGGCVVITSSSAGLKGVGSSSGSGEGYVASKHAVAGVMRTFATNHAKHNISFNTTRLTDTTGAVEIDAPRDRAASFEPQIVKKGQRQRWLAGVNEIVLSSRSVSHALSGVDTCSM